jgi:uncharacterized coiled-coil protein SlyX
MKGVFIMNANEIANILANISAVNIQNDSMSEFTQDIKKEDLVREHKESFNAKWAAWDAFTGIANFAINQYRHKKFEHLQENAEAEAEIELKEREERLNQLKKNLGITDLEEKIQKQDEVLENISKMLSHLVTENKKEKKQVKDLLPTKFKKKEEDDKLC